MKKVLYLYDNLSQEKNLHNLTFIETYKQYQFEDVFLNDIKGITEEFERLRPDVLILNCDFEYNKQIDIIKSISKSHEPCKIIVIIGNKEFQEMLFHSKYPKYPNRIFYRNTANDILANSISALLIEKSLSVEEIYKNEKYKKIIDSFGLKIYNGASKHFIKGLSILYNNPLLLDGHLNNVYYAVSKYDNVSYSAVKKSIATIISTMKNSGNKIGLYSIFNTDNIKSYTPNEVLDKIVSYIKLL